MKTKSIPILFFLALIFAGCAGPTARHDARVDRRSDRHDNRQDRRYDRYDDRQDRRYDRQERIENRYGY